MEDFLSEETCVILLQSYVVTPLKAQILLLICPAQLISIIFLFPALSLFSPCTDIIDFEDLIRSISK